MDNKKKEVYVLLPNHQSEWEDIQIFLSKQDAIDALNQIESSLPDGHSYKDGWRIEIFNQKKNVSYSYTPTYESIQNINKVNLFVSKLYL